MKIALEHFLYSSSINFAALSAIQFFIEKTGWFDSQFFICMGEYYFSLIKGQHSNIALKNEFIVEDPSCH